MSDDQIFVDTNILIYAHDRDGRNKHLLARSKIEELSFPPARKWPQLRRRMIKSQIRNSK